MRNYRKWVSIDPGKRGCGVSVFVDEVLCRATYIAGPPPSSSWLADVDYLARRTINWIEQPYPNLLVVEVPRIYPGHSGRENPNDLLPLTALLGAVIGRCGSPEIIQYAPHDWKGSIKKEAMVERIKAAVTDVEREKVDLPTAADLRHNVWDGIGIGMYYLGRLERRRVIAR